MKQEKVWSLNPDKKSSTIQLSDRVVRNLADEIFKNLQSEGCNTKDIISVSTQLLDLVVSEIKKTNDPSSEPTS